MTTTAAELQRRFLPLGEAETSEDRLTFSFSSEAAIARFYGDEVLDHDAESVNLSRLNAGAAPLLFNHDPDKVLGLVERAWIDPQKRRGMASIRWATNDLARQVRADVEAGVMPNISVGYAIDQAVSDDDGVIRATSWQPHELSVVSIPADPSIGINRSHQPAQAMTTSVPTISTGWQHSDEYTRESEQFSIVRAIQASASGDWSAAGREREVSQELALRAGRQTTGFFVPEVGGWEGRRDYVKGTATAGGNLVATELLADSFIDALRARLAVAELGATMLPGLVGDVAIPRRTASATSYWVTEGADITESTGAFDQVSMNPKVVGCFSKFSHLMKLQSTPEIENLIRQDFVAKIAETIDLAAINGSGSSGQPTGILQTTGIGSVAGGSNGLAPTLDHLLDLKKAVAIDNADVSTCGYLTNSRVEAALSQLKDGNAAYHLNPYGSEVGRQQIASRRLVVSNNVPSDLTKGTGTGLSAVIYGNFSDLLIGMWGTLEVLTDPYTQFQSGTVQVRAMQALDIAVRHPESFAAMTDAIA